MSDDAIVRRPVGGGIQSNTAANSAFKTDSAHCPKPWKDCCCGTALTICRLRSEKINKNTTDSITLCKYKVSKIELHTELKSHFTFNPPNHWSTLIILARSSLQPLAHKITKMCGNRFRAPVDPLSIVAKMLVTLCVRFRWNEATACGSKRGRNSSALHCLLWSFRNKDTDRSVYSEDVIRCARIKRTTREARRVNGL